MDLVGIAINAAVVAGVGLTLGWLGKGRFEAQDRRTDRLEHKMDGFQASLDTMRSEFTQSQATMRSEFTRSQDTMRSDFTQALDTLRSDITQSLDVLRSDLTQVALAVGVPRRTSNA
jgi:hypothetical protein